MGADRDPRDWADRDASIELRWLYQAGFILQFNRGQAGLRIGIDPYLSDALRASHGIGRTVPAPIKVEELQLDILLVTHVHEDHLDPEVVKTLGRSELVTHFVGPPSAAKAARTAGFPVDRLHALSRGERIAIDGALIEAVFARHEFEPDPTPDAIGYLVQVGGLSVYHSGDTEYDARIIHDISERVDVCLVCINGVTGNMNAVEAATLAYRIAPRVAVPMHYGLWEDYGPGATVSPTEFERYCNLLAPDLDVQIMDASQPWIYP